MVGWPCHFWAHGRQAHHGRDHVVKDAAYRMVDRKQKSEAEEGLRSQHPLQGHSCQ